MRRKTLLLLWWIDGGRMVVEHSTLAWQDRLGGGSGYPRMSVWVSNLLTLSMVAMGLLL